jgi:hypothetical protein
MPGWVARSSAYQNNYLQLKPEKLPVQFGSIYAMASHEMQTEQSGPVAALPVGYEAWIYSYVSSARADA